uniref:Uncharacterized protein n=1 Tax=Anguilla anguilla TaxID=7936 RepID=A0A0E9UBB4_ANGAN
MIEFAHTRRDSALLAGFAFFARFMHT